MDIVTIILLIILGILGTAFVTTMLLCSWAIHQIDKEERRKFQEYQRYNT